jgi:hypothetical protein
MSHSWEGKNGTGITYNPDLSDVRVRGWTVGEDEYGTEVCLDIEDARDLLEFVADYVRREKISRLEQMSTQEILGLEGE